MEEQKVFFYWIQVARFFAAVWVVFYHGERQLFFGDGRTELLTHGYGHYGVDFFFCLSGFIILISNKKKFGDLAYTGTFFLNRFARATNQR